MRYFLLFGISILFLITSCNKHHNGESLDIMVSKFDTVSASNKNVIIAKIDQLYKNNKLPIKYYKWYVTSKSNDITNVKEKIFFLNNTLEKIKGNTIEENEVKTIIYNLLTSIYINKTDCDYAVRFAYKSVESHLQLKSSDNEIATSYHQLSLAYRTCNDFSNYFKYLQMAASVNKDTLLSAILYHDMGDYYLAVGQLDSGYVFTNKAIKIYQTLNDTIQIAKAQLNIATYYNITNRIDSALTISNQAIGVLEKLNLSSSFYDVLLARLYFKKNDFAKSDIYFKKALQDAKNDEDKISVYNNYSFLFEAKKDYVNTIRCMDSIIDISNRFYSEEMINKTKEVEENFFIKQKDINIKQLELQNQAAKNKINLSIALLLLSLVALLLFYQFYKNKKLQEANTRTALEQKLFTSQMSPHFMFNALSAIQAEVLSNNTKVANNYLTKFGQLLQNILTSTTQESIAINIEYKNLLNYIELQEIRFKNFTYKLDVFEGIEDDEDLIPPMLLQPLVENAIEHGLKGLDYNGILVLTIKKFDDYLACEIIDNGNGLRTDLNTSKPSLSTSLIKQRLQFLSKEFNIDCDLNISNNLTGNGVVCKIKIPYKSRF